MLLGRAGAANPHVRLAVVDVSNVVGGAGPQRNERRNGSERGLAQCTATWVAGALRQPQGALTSARADALYRKSANRTDVTANVVSRLPSTGVWRHSVKIFSTMSEVGKWPDQNGQSRLSAPVSEFVEAGEPIERRNASAIPQ